MWTQERTSFAVRHYQLTGAVAEPKPVQQPHPPIWIGGAGRRRTLRIAAQHASVWNAPGGSPEEVADLSGVLDRHCADIGRDPGEIRRSVQVRMPATPDELLAVAPAESRQRECIGDGHGLLEVDLCRLQIAVLQFQHAQGESSCAARLV